MRLASAVVPAHTLTLWPWNGGHLAEEYVNGNQRITLTVNDAIKGIVFVATIVAVGYGVVRRMDQMQDQITALTNTVAVTARAQEARDQKQQEDIEAWKRATADLVFRKR